MGVSSPVPKPTHGRGWAFLSHYFPFGVTVTFEPLVDADVARSGSPSPFTSPTAMSLGSYAESSKTGESNPPESLGRSPSRQLPYCSVSGRSRRSACATASATGRCRTP